MRRLAIIIFFLIPALALGQTVTKTRTPTRTRTPNFVTTALSSIEGKVNHLICDSCGVYPGLTCPPTPTVTPQPMGARPLTLEERVAELERQLAPTVTPTPFVEWARRGIPGAAPTAVACYDKRGRATARWAVGYDPGPNPCGPDETTKPKR